MTDGKRPMTNDADGYCLIEEAMRDIVAGLGGDEAKPFLRDWPDHPRRRDVTSTVLPVIAQLVHLKRCAIADLAVLIDRFLHIARIANSDKPIRRMISEPIF